MSPKEFDQMLNRIVLKLKSEYLPEKVILFGSYSRGVDDSESDIDLLIIKDTRERLIDRWTTVRRILSDPARTVALDTLVLTPHELADRVARGDQFLAEILQEGKVLYAA